jgi:DedD protein
MDKALKQRLVGASVLIVLAVIVLPMLLSGRSDTFKSESRQIELPPKPEELSFETRRFPVGIPEQPVTAAARDTDGQPVIDDAAGTLPLQQDQDQETAIQPPIEESTEDNVVAVTNTPGESGTAAVEAPPAVTSVILEPTEKVAVAELESEPKPEPAANKQGQPRYLVQVASFSSEKRANAMAADLLAANMPVVMDVVDRTAGRLHRVRVGPYVERSEADAVVARIRSINKDLSPRIMDTRPDDSSPVTAPSDPLVRWVVQVGSYSNGATADSEVAKLRLAGLTAFSEKVTSAKGTTYKVRIGPEINRESAVQLAKDIKVKHHIDGFVTTQE